jgi:lipopolysaccharide transport system ATP-binding protein
VGTGFHPERTGRENIFLNGAVLGMTRTEIRRNFDDIVAFAAVERFLDTPVKRYSSGMYVRLAFSVAAHLNPEILLVDEVLAVGDAQFQKKCLGKMEEVSASGRTVLFVSHSLPTVLRLCPRALLFEAGRLKMDGGSSEVTQSYLETKPEESEGYVDLRNAPRRGGMGERFRYTGCAVLNSQGQETGRLLFGEPMTIRIEAETTDALRDVGLAVGIDTFSEVRVVSMLSEDSGVTFDYAPKEPRAVTAGPQHLALTPGKYYVTLGARHRTQALDQLSQALSFEVDSVPWENMQLPAESWGILHVPVKWDAVDA